MIDLAGMNNIPVFPVKTGLSRSVAGVGAGPGDGQTDPAKMKAFLASYPETAKAMQLIGNRAISSGFDNSTYNSLNAFRFFNASGAVVPVPLVDGAGPAVRANQHDRPRKGRKELPL